MYKIYPEYLQSVSQLMFVVVIVVVVVVVVVVAFTQAAQREKS